MSSVTTTMVREITVERVPDEVLAEQEEPIVEEPDDTVETVLVHIVEDKEEPTSNGKLPVSNAFDWRELLRTEVKRISAFFGDEYKRRLLECAATLLCAFAVFFVIVLARFAIEHLTSEPEAGGFFCTIFDGVDSVLGTSTKDAFCEYRAGALTRLWELSEKQWNEIVYGVSHFSSQLYGGYRACITIAYTVAQYYIGLFSSYFSELTGNLSENVHFATSAAHSLANFIADAARNATNYVYENVMPHEEPNNFW